MLNDPLSNGKETSASISSSPPIRTLFLWTNMSGYMAAAWRALQKHSAIQTKIVALRESEVHPATQFSESLYHGLDLQLISYDECMNGQVVDDVVRDFKPEVIVTAGWIFATYRRVCIRAAKQGVSVVMIMDTPWQNKFKQHFTWLRHRRFLSSVQHLFVASQQASLYGSKLGFANNQITDGLYSWDQELADATRKHENKRDRAGLLYVGRYVESKGIHELLDAYKVYRERVPDPWPLHCCGIGPLSELISSSPGVVNHGFIQPQDLPRFFAENTAYILPSRYEPWGVALVEALGCGLPVIATTACGAARAIVKNRENGVIVPPNSSKHLLDSILYLHRLDMISLNKMRCSASNSARPFTATSWAARVEAMLFGLRRNKCE